MRDGAHFFDGAFHVALAEKTGAADENVGAGFGALGGGLEINPAIDGDGEFIVAFGAPGASPLDLGKRFGNERLTAESGVDRHDKY